MAFTKTIRVRRLFCEITGDEFAEESFLKKKASRDKKVEVIIDEEKQFGIHYNYDSEEISFDFFYGFWNKYGWPQHV